MKKTIHFLFLLLVLGWSACGDDETDPSYKGKNEINLSAVETTTLVDDEGTKLLIDLMLAKTPDHQVELTFKLDGHIQNSVELVSLTTTKIVIPANKKTAQLEIISNNKGILMSNIPVALVLETTSDPDISQKRPFTFTLKPGSEVPILTEAQQQLLKAYDEKGWNIRQWLGLVPVKVRVDFPGNVGFAPLDEPYTREISGKTPITLSENATSDSPVLKMTSNAMGIANYLHEIIRGETVLNNDYWWDPVPMPVPNAEMAIRLLGLTKDGAEEFDAALDNLKLNMDDKTVDFVTKNVLLESFYPELTDVPRIDYLTIVNFDYTYSVWDRMKKLIDEGNEEMKLCYSQGGSMHPTAFINTSSIDTDDYGANNNWTAPISSFDFSTGEISFVFCMSHLNSIDYIRFTVTYSPAE